MASDARALLRAATAQRRPGIQDRFASYNPSTNALRCSACNFLPIKHESLWSSHAASKSHRANVVRLLDEERKAEAAAAVAAAAANAKGKRKQADDTEDGDADISMDYDGPVSSGPGNLPSSAGQPGPHSKRARLEGAAHSPAHPAAAAAAAAATAPIARAVDEDEWARFEREVLEGDGGPDAGVSASNEFDMHAAATAISAEPVLHADEDEDGAAGAGANAQGMETAEDPQDAAAAEEARRLEREREEREEILMRFEEEQRIQDEADERVNALKNRIQALKAARAARKLGSGGAEDSKQRDTGAEPTSASSSTQRRKAKAKSRT